MSIVSLRDWRDFYFSPYTVLIEPYKEAYKNLQFLFTQKVQHIGNKEPLSLSKRIVCILEILLYIFPLINSIAYVAMQILKTSQKKEEWKKYYESHPLHQLSEKNLRFLQQSLAPVIKDAARGKEEETQSIFSYPAELHFDIQGNLRDCSVNDNDNLLLDEWTGDPKEPQERNLAKVNLYVNPTANKSHHPFTFNVEGLSYYKGAGWGIFQNVMQLMVDELNNSYSHLPLLIQRYLRLSCEE